MNILELQNVSKSLSHKKIIDDISFSINEGDIVGLVGPNGAGKTTLIRIITSLIRPDNGRILIGEHGLHKDREKALSCISAIVENPGLYNYMSGRQNIDIIRQIHNISKEKMNNIINYIGMQNYIDKKVSKYSLGMKQRLALGMCLITEPELLILDEPTNGLDASGIIDLRNKLTDLSNNNHSVLISSHALSEIDKICNKIIFIKEGRIVNTISKNKDLNIQKIKIGIDNNDTTNDFLKKCKHVYNYYRINDILYIELNKNDLSSFLIELTHNNIEFSNLEIINSLLEEEYSAVYRGEK